MSFATLFVLKLSPDEIVHESAELYRDWYQVPVTRRWSNVGDQSWSMLADDCFENSDEKPTINDKMIILAHGATTYVGGDDNTPKLDAIDLVRAMRKWGLTDIGLISFKCCHVGKSSFLPTFVTAASRYNLGVGWVKGYTGAARTLRKFPYIGKPTELISRPVTIFDQDFYLPIFGADRVKIIPGNKSVSIPDSRYLLESDDNNRI